MPRRKYYYGRITEAAASIGSDPTPPPGYRGYRPEVLNVGKISRLIRNYQPTVEEVFSKLCRFTDREVRCQPRLVQVCSEQKRLDLLAMLSARFGVSVDTSFVESATLGNRANPGTVKNSTPLIAAVERGDELIARMLVQALGADPNHIIMAAGTRKECAWPEIGNTALLSAIAVGREGMVRVLVQELGADVNLSSAKIMRFHYERGELQRSEVICCQTPLLFAIERENPAMVILLLRLGADPDVMGWTRTHDHSLVCGNLIQLAEIRFEDREPAVMEELQRALDLKNTTDLSQLRDRVRTDNVELNRKLISATAKLEVHTTFLRRMRKSIECNICLDIPSFSNKVYICCNSHILCQSCIARVTECPLCKINFNVVRPIRNRLAESILNDLENLNLRDLA